MASEDQSAGEHAGNANIALSDEEWEIDSAVGDLSNYSSYSTSLSPSVMEYKYENGRRYHAYKEGTYLLPNDDEELERLDLQHHLWRMTLGGKLYLSPLPSPVSSALDIGTGTGIWAVEFAEEHPYTSVLGVDLSPVQPNQVPPNCTFQVDDMESDWIFTKPFSFIHGRMLGGAVHSWPNLFRQSFDNLTPGGWVEFQEFSFTPQCEEKVCTHPHFHDIVDKICVAGAKLGINGRIAPDLGRLMEEAGFEGVQTVATKWPMGEWSKDKKMKTLGKWARTNISTGISGISMAFLTRVGGFSRESVELMLVDVRKELNDPDVHHWMDIYVHYGQKPEIEKETQQGTRSEEAMILEEGPQSEEAMKSEEGMHSEEATKSAEAMKWEEASKLEEASKPEEVTEISQPEDTSKPEVITQPGDTSKSEVTSKPEELTESESVIKSQPSHEVETGQEIG